MKKTLVLLIGLAFAGVAQAQIKCWTGADGKRACGDNPPPGAKTSIIKTRPAPAQDADAAKDGAKDAKKGPLSAADREQDYRKRQVDAQKAADKAGEEKKIADAKRENCERANEALRSYESGRVARTDAKGERYFLDDAQLAQERAKARQIAQDSCGS